MACDRCNYFSFWAIFCPKNQNFKEMKKIPGHIVILHMCTKIMIRSCTVPEIWCMTDRWTDR